MGGGNWTDTQWQKYATAQNYSNKSTQQIFTQFGLKPELNPAKFDKRESRDSTDNPMSTPIIVGLDVTGSMGRLADAMVRQGLNTLCTEIYARKPVTNPHVLCMGIGDVHCDSAPIQATQFEADIRIVQQLEQIWLEGGGGGNGSESYTAAWYFAAKKTVTDSFAKRKKKGYIFTVGDDGPNGLKRSQIKKYLDLDDERDYSAEELLHMASRQWEVFHLVVKEGGTYTNDMFQEWQKILGERALLLVDHTKMAEVIVSTMQVLEGQNSHNVINSWDGTTALAVRAAVSNLVANQNANVVRF